MKSFVNRAVDPDGDKILVFQDDDERKAQGVVQVDVSGNPVSNYLTNDIAEVGDTIYVGKQQATGDWMIQKVTASSIRYATEVNNPTVVSYADAWLDYTNLIYSTYAEVI